VQQWRHLDH